MYLYLSIHFFIQNASLKLIWYCWSKLKQKFSIWGEFDHQKDSERFMLVIGLCNRSVHIMYARCCRTFLGVNFVVAFFSFIFVNIYFRPTLGSPSFICPSFRFVTHIALSWLSFNNNNTYIAPISILLYIYIYIYQLFSFPLYWSSVYSVKVFVKLGSDLRLLNSECFHGHSVKSK